MILSEGDSLGREISFAGETRKETVWKIHGGFPVDNFADIRVLLKEKTVSLGKKSRLEKPSAVEIHTSI